MVPMERLRIIVGTPRNAWPRLILILLFKNSAETKLNDNFFKKDLFMNTATTPPPAALSRPAQPFPRTLRWSPHPTPTPGRPRSRRARPARAGAPKSSVALVRSDRRRTAAALLATAAPLIFFLRNLRRTIKTTRSARPAEHPHRPGRPLDPVRSSAATLT